MNEQYFSGNLDEKFGDESPKSEAFSEGKIQYREEDFTLLYNYQLPYD